MKRNRRTKKNREKQLCIRLFSYLFCWFWVFSCLFTAVKEIKQININGCDIAIEWLKIDKILMCYFLFLFSFYFFSLFFCAPFFSVRALFSFYNLVEIDCGFSRRVASVSTIFFFSFFLEYISYCTLIIGYLFFAHLCHESKICYVCI